MARDARPQSDYAPSAVPRWNFCFGSSWLFYVYFVALFVAMSVIDILYIMLKATPNIKIENR